MTIEERISSVQIMQRFVRMSRVLIPVYAELISREELTEEDKQKINKIKRVYENFTANPKASEYLIDSNVLELIAKV